MLKITEETQLEQINSSEQPQANTQLDFGQVCAHLSNEHTFLAWIWTGVILMGFGVAIAKMRIAVSSLSQATGSFLQSSGNHEARYGSKGTVLPISAWFCF